MAKYIIRLDDICPQMKWRNFERLKVIFDRYNIKPIIGVIPNNKDSKISFVSKTYNKEFWQYIKSLKKKGWTIAIHGYEHKTYKKLGGGILNISDKSEFAKLPLKVQYEKLKKAKEIFEKEGLKTKVFVAPSHSFDENTIKALKKLRFRYISDGFTLYPYKKKGIIFVPQLFSYPLALPFGIYTICIHPNTLSKKDIIKIEQFIKKNRKNIISFESSEKYLKDTLINKIIGKILQRTINNIRKILKVIKVIQ